MTIVATPKYAWVDTGVRFFRVTYKGGYYTARCGQFKGRGTTLHAAVKKAAMQCARPRPIDYTMPF